ncbi:AlpA family phage regulatory protein [Arsenophonus endosymbiont of Bemisia tabaci Asia II 3]|nr:AlpA family phage regulatory protein [Arsenophonus endosymbiont of Bemisia tabaci Asia II 3]
MATRYIGIKEMCQLTGKSHPTLWWMWAKKKDFPAPRKSRSGTCLGRTERDYEEWVEAQRVNNTR